MKLGRQHKPNQANALHNEPTIGIETAPILICFQIPQANFHDAISSGPAKNGGLAAVAF